MDDLKTRHRIRKRSLENIALGVPMFFADFGHGAQTSEFGRQHIAIIKEELEFAGYICSEIQASKQLIDGEKFTVVSVTPLSMLN